MTAQTTVWSLSNHDVHSHDAVLARTHNLTWTVAAAVAAAGDDGTMMMMMMIFQCWLRMDCWHLNCCLLCKVSIDLTYNYIPNPWTNIFIP